MRGSHPLPDQLPGEHTGPHHTLCSIPSTNRLQCCHSYTHSLIVDRSTVVGHVPTVHMCSFMCLLSNIKKGDNIWRDKYVFSISCWGVRNTHCWWICWFSPTCSLGVCVVNTCLVTLFILKWINIQTLTNFVLKQIHKKYPTDLGDFRFLLSINIRKEINLSFTFWLSVEPQQLL